MKFSPALLKQLRIQASQGSEPARKQLQAWARAKKPRAKAPPNPLSWLERYGNPRTWQQDILAQTDGARILDGLNKYGAFNPLPHLKRYAHLLRGGDRQPLSRALERTALQHLERDRALTPLRQAEDRTLDGIRSLFTARPRTPTSSDLGINMDQVRDMQRSTRAQIRGLIPELRDARATRVTAESLFGRPEPLEPLFRALDREGRSVARARAGTGLGVGGTLTGLGTYLFGNRQKEATMKKQAMPLITPGLQVGTVLGALSGVNAARKDPRRSYPEEVVGGGLRGGVVGSGVSAGALTGTALAQSLAPDTYSRLLQSAMNEDQGLGVRGLALAALLAPTLAGGYAGGRIASRGADLIGGQRQGKRASTGPGTGHVPPSSFQSNPLQPPRPIQPIKPAPVQNPVQPPAPKPIMGAGPRPMPFKRKTPNYWGSKV